MIIKDQELLFWAALTWGLMGIVLLWGAYQDYKKKIREKKKNNELLKGN